MFTSFVFITSHCFLCTFGPSLIESFAFLLLCYEHSFPQCSFISFYLISGMSFSTSFLWLTLSHCRIISGIQVCRKAFLWELYIASVSTITPNAYFSQSLFLSKLYSLAYWSIIIKCKFMGIAQFPAKYGEANNLLKLHAKCYVSQSTVLLKRGYIAFIRFSKSKNPTDSQIQMQTFLPHHTRTLLITNISRAWW